MAFSTWAVELQRFKDAINAVPISQLLKAGYSDAKGQLITFRRFADIEAHVEYLERRVLEESRPGGRRSGFISSGYRGR